MKKLAILALVLAVSFMPLAAFAQQETQPPTEAPQQPSTAAPPHQHGMQQMPGRQQGAAGQEMMEMCKQMMAKKQEMMAKMKEMDETLKKEVADMNAATGDEKIQGMADVINMLVDQRIEMREMAMNMHEGMMGHMGQHMQSTDNQTRSMSGCPMMQMMQKKQGMHGGHGAPQGAGSGAAGQ